METYDSELRGVPVRAANGERIGEVEGVRVDRHTGKPESIEVAADVAENPGLVVPAPEVEVTEDGIFLVADAQGEGGSDR